MKFLFRAEKKHGVS